MRYLIGMFEQNDSSRKSGKRSINDIASNLLYLCAGNITYFVCGDLSLYIIEELEILLPHFERISLTGMFV
jgi:hypothetical protein